MSSEPPSLEPPSLQSPPPGAGERPRRATSADVAREAGLSRATVGYVLNGVPHQTIPEPTRQRVLAAAAKLGYTPSAVARSLRSGRSEIVLCLLPDWPVGHSLVTLLDELSGQLERQGFTFVTHPRSATSRSVSEIWKSITPAVVLTFTDLAAADLEALLAAGVRVVNIREVTGGSAGTAAAEERVGWLQATHLAQTGRHALGYAYPADPRVGVFAEPRLRGARRGSAAHNLPPPLVREVQIDPTAVDQALDAWLSVGVDGVCCYNDEVAIALLGAAGRRGVEVPGGVAVVGVDDVPLAALVHPALTTVRADFERQAARVAARLTGGDLTPPAPGAYELIRRSSS